MNSDSNLRGIKIYRAGAVDLHLQGYVTNEGRLLEDDLTSTEFDILHFIFAETWKHPRHKFTKEEVWTAIWPTEASLVDTLADKDRAAKLAKDLGNRVSKNISNIRGKLPGLIPKEGYFLSAQVSDATPPESKFLVAHRVLFACTIAVVMTTVIDTIARSCLAAAGLTLTQSPDLGFVLGWFQGVIGSLVWSLVISISLVYTWFVVDQFRPWAARFPRLKGACIGGLAGLAGGILNSFALLKAQHPDTLRYAGWIPPDATSIWTAFSITRMGYAMPWYGACIGAGCGFIVLWIVGRPEWNRFISENPKLTESAETVRVVKALFVLALKWGAAFILPSMALAAALFTLVLPNRSKLPQILGESFCIAIGGVALVSGLLIALYSLTKGMDITGESKCSLELNRSPVSPAATGI